MRCCAGDEGFVALRSHPAEGGFKPTHAALAEDCCGVVNMNAEDKSGSGETGVLGAGCLYEQSLTLLPSADLPAATWEANITLP